MKIIYFLFPLFIATACKTQTGTVTAPEKTIMKNSNMDRKGCPSDGTCSVKVLKDKSLEIRKDETMRTIYPEIVDGNNIVVEYTYFRSGPEGTADGNYSETIQFELPAKTKDLVKQNGGLADVKMLFGKSGYRNLEYHMVSDGKLSVQNTENGLSFTLDFKMDKTPQVVTHINESITLR
ncbi:hypothetical protein EI546_08560 [Aequorivita sp. H23M31]|uniref:Uncharacterized protein n=1 Tax=Aequorivita ciconiae TaxID=2494375 RepID=A0A410G3A2_9FLAO|nr:hypothetical protein [Aequorivita sp. H23M31]QAA81768.1 hypothetical protein EI546_08560 [Aequorivita sp. H23M31]